MTQAELAQSIGVTDSYISHLEHGDFLTKEGTPARPAKALIDKMADALGVSCEEARRAATYAPRNQAAETTFGKWLRQTRLKSGTSQETLAHSIGVTAAYISLLEGERVLTKQGAPVRLSLHLVDAIAWTLGTSCEEARLAAGFAPPETVPSALHKLSLLDMFLRLPVDVQEDFKTQVEALYFKHCARKIIASPRAQIRININRDNQSDVIPFIKFARSRGWFNRSCQAVIQPARLSSYSEHSAFMRESELSLEEYNEIRRLVRNEVGTETAVEESESPDGFPYPKTSVCAALANDSIVVGADGRQYHCGLQAAETHRAVGSIRRLSKRELPVISSLASHGASDESWWREFDPTILPNCSRCSFLPICWGGCPKKHLERDDHAIAEQSRYWRMNLPRLIASGVNAKAPADFAFSEADQFR